MNKDFWLNKWKTKNIGFNQTQPNNFLVNFGKQIFENSKNIFVPLCGKSIDMIWLYENNYNILGVELADIACYEFFQENNIKFKSFQKDKFICYISEDERITILQGDFFDISQNIIESYQIDGIYDRASLVALPKDMRKKYANHIINITKNQKIINYLLIVFEFPSEEGPPFSIPESEVYNLYNNYFVINRIVEEDILFRENDIRKHILYHLVKK